MNGGIEMGVVTRRKVLLECLERLRMERNRFSMLGQGLTARPGFLDEFAEAQSKVDIMKDIIHYFDTEAGERGIADWQRQEMQDPERIRREAMRFTEE
jgi:hypothetical protein